MKTSKICVTALGCLVSFAMAGCASAPPPRQLLDARAAYNEARMGKAAEVAPAELHTAKVALNAAEDSYQDDAESPQTYALAYVALRTAQLVQAQAETKSAKADLDRAQREIDQLEADEMARTRDELMKAKQQLAVRSEQLTAAGAQLQTKDEQLAQERAARAAAEERERDAMRKLAAAAALSVKEEPRGTVIVLPGSVLFTSGKSELAPEAQQKLGLVADTIVPQASTHEITVEGHTDSKGTPESNQVLSESRARAVMDFLISRGVPPQSITSVGIGQDRPMADNSTPEGRANNRRVEIIVKQREAR